VLRTIHPSALQTNQDLSVGLNVHPFRGEGRASDIAAQTLQSFSIVCADNHPGVKVEPADL